jgi:hypothetical protein
MLWREVFGLLGVFLLVWGWVVFGWCYEKAF